MFFSIIVPFLNEEKRIEKCLQALINQDFAKNDFELIFIDNGSDDRSAEIVRQYPVTLLNESRKDPYIARNRGIEAAKGEYIIFTDADCIAAPDWLSRYYENIQNTRADIVIGSLLYPSPTPLALKCHEEYYHTKMVNILESRRSEYYYGHAGNMAVHSRVFAETGLFSGMPIVGDTEIIHNLLAVRADAGIVYAPEAKVVHDEVTRFGHHLYKLYECGQYSETYKNASAYRPLQLQDNIQLALRCIRDHRFSLWKTAVFGSSLVSGYLFYMAGRITRRFRKPERPAAKKVLRSQQQG